MPKKKKEWQRIEPNIALSLITQTFRVRVTQNGKTLEQKGISTLEEARLIKSQFKLDLHNRIDYDITFDEFYNLTFYPAQYNDPTIAATTVSTNDSAWRNHISPAIGKLKMRKEMPLSSEVQRYLLNGERPDGKSVEPLTHATAIRCLRVLRSVVRLAAGENLCELPAWVDPNFKWRYPKRKPSKGGDLTEDLWSDDEALAATKILFENDSPLTALWCCMYGGGLRRHEAHALTYGDLQFSRDVVENCDKEILVCRLHVENCAASKSKLNNRRLIALASGISEEEIPLSECLDVEGKTKTLQSKRWATITPPCSEYLYRLASKHELTDPICANETNPAIRMKADRISNIWRKYWPKQNITRSANEHETTCANGAELRWQIKICRCRLWELRPDKDPDELIEELDKLQSKLDARPDAPKAKSWRQRSEKITAWLERPNMKQRKRIEQKLATLQEQYAIHQKYGTRHGKYANDPDDCILSGFRFMQLRLARAIHNSNCRNAGILDDMNELAHGRTPKTTGAQYYEWGSIEVADKTAFAIHKWRVERKRKQESTPLKPLLNPTRQKKLGESREGRQKTDGQMIPIIPSSSDEKMHQQCAKTHLPKHLQRKGRSML